MRTISKEELAEILKKHKMWLDDDPNGKRACLSHTNLSHTNLSHTDLSHTDLSGADLSWTNLSYTNLSYTNLSYTDLSWTNLSNTNLSYTDLSYTDMLRANMSGADLSGADLDYSVLPLWCGSLNAGFDDRQIKQIAYHMVKAGLSSKNTSDETKRQLAKIIDFANEFHRAEECGIIKNTEEL